MDIFCKQEILHSINGNMHASLNDKSKFSLLGQCISNGQVFFNGVEEGDLRKSHTHSHSVDGITKCCGQWSSGCSNLSWLLDQCGQTYIENDYLIELAYESFHLRATGICWIPKLHHIHWKGEIVSQCDVHVCKSDCLYWLDGHLSCIS